MQLTRLKKFIYNTTHWESWHYLAKYLPIGPVWLWYALRSRSLWWFTPSNPTLTFGGFEGEKKGEMYNQLPPEFVPRTIYISNSKPFEDVKKRVANEGFKFPFAVKPNAGMMGFMFRKIYSYQHLQAYHSKIGVEYLVQELVEYPLEVSVFYYRYPGADKGKITGFIRKEYMKVVGDGYKTLDQLISEYSRAHLKIDEIRSKNKNRLNDILPRGESLILSQALNLSRGGKLISLKHEIDEKLLAVFDNLSHYSGSFYYGRYDIKCTSIEDLKNGRNFMILEFNGSGAEPHHIYGNGNTLLQAYSIVLHHWQALYKISSMNYKKGIPYWKFRQGWDFLGSAKKHFRSLKKLETSFQY